jgi:hypothetical protein
MSIAGRRAAIADACTNATGLADRVKVYAHRRQVPAPQAGDGWVNFRGFTRGPASAYTAVYTVTIVLPSDEGKADEWIENNTDALDDALRPVLFVDSFQPAELPLIGNSAALALLITGRSE